MSQPEEVRQVFHHNGVTLYDAIRELLDLTVWNKLPVFTRHEDLSVLQNAYPAVFNNMGLDFHDIGKIINSAGIPSTSFVVCPAFYDSVLAASADGATLRNLWRAQENNRAKSAA
jgi:hypothetical protein